MHEPCIVDRESLDHVSLNTTTHFFNWHDQIQNNQNLTTIGMVMKCFENHSLFCKNELYEKEDA